MLKQHNTQKGDTLVEVMLAVVILSAITVGVFGIMNRGVAMSYGILERAEVRARADEQLELLTYFRDVALSSDDLSVYPASVWSDIKNRATTSSLSGVSFDSCSPHSSSFFIRYNTTNPATPRYELVNYSEPTGVARLIPVAGDGLWVEASKLASGSNPAYVDFYVKSCWQKAGGAGPNENLSSVLRLYDR